jgi:hypothetical protein
VRHEEILLLVSGFDPRDEGAADMIREAKRIAPHLGTGLIIETAAAKSPEMEEALLLFRYLFFEPGDELQLVDMVLGAVIDVEERIFKINCGADPRTMQSSPEGEMRRDRMLFQSEELVEGLLKTTVQSIELRDRSAEGHSMRVALLARSAALLINRTTVGVFGEIHFDSAAITELYYAAIIHSYGKLYVEPEIFEKEGKLYPEQLQRVNAKIDYLSLYQELLFARQKLQIGNSYDAQRRSRLLTEIEEEKMVRLQQIEGLRRRVEELNAGAIPVHSSKREVQDLAESFSALKVRDPRGNSFEILDGEEREALSVPVGVLTPDQRRRYEEHIRYSYEFARRLPWPDHLENTPRILEKLYRKLGGKDERYDDKEDLTALSANIIAAADLYDVLWTEVGCEEGRRSRRKVELALQFEAAEKRLDQDVVDLFTWNLLA